MNRQKWIAIMKKIFILPPVPTVLVALPSFLLVFYVLTKILGQPMVESFFSETAYRS